MSGDDRLEPCGLISSAKLVGFTVVAGYERLLGLLERFGTIDYRGDPAHPVGGASVVAVPYDFRCSIVAAAERLDAVVCAHFGNMTQTERAGRVVVVAHSMGGLVARVWLGLLGRWPWCRSLITLGTPHRGAPKALTWLVNGVPLISGVTEVLRGWESVYELLPRYPVIRDTASGRDRYPHQLDIPWLRSRAKAGYQLHGEIEKSWNTMPRMGPVVVPCIGWSHPTPDACVWEDGRLRVTKTPWITAQGWKRDFGDGTVPAYSALPIEMNDQITSRIPVRERHGRLAHADVITTLIHEQFDYQSPTMAAGPGELPPAIGLDIDEVHPAGAPIPLTVALRRVTADISKQRVWARSRARDTGGPWDRSPLTWDESAGVFVGEPPSQALGLYEVQIRARAVGGVGDLECADTVAVVEGG